MTSRWGSFGFGAILVASISASSAGQSYPALRGVDSVRVSIFVDASRVNANIDSAAIRTSVELELRRDGLIVVEPGALYFGPTLVLSFQVMPVSSFADASVLLGYAYDIVLQLRESVLVARGSSGPFVSATTWINDMLGTAMRDGNLSDRLVGATHQLVDSFLNDYLAANPRRH